jgi:beta-phosphoglucomutase
LSDGFDVLVGIARFWADRVHYSKRNDKYMIHGVTGPNEYENNINNNWYTNYLAKWCLTYTVEVAKKVSTEKTSLLEISLDELSNWQDIIAKLYLPEDKDLGIFIQHDGFLDKDLTPVAKLDPANLPLNQNWSWDKILRSAYIKQADVLQGIYYFMDQFTEEEKKRNYDFYEPLTVHESSLSPSVHAILAADLHEESKAVEMYARTARLDLDNYNNDTEDGLHITSMTGSWLSIIQGFAGLRVREGRLYFSPFVPKDWEGYSFHINFRGRLIKLNVTKEETQVLLLEGEELTLVLYDDEIRLKKLKRTMKGVLFDLDGVIADTSAYHFAAWRNVIQKNFQRELPTELEVKTKGVSREDSLEVILDYLGVTLSQEKFNSLCNEKNNAYVDALDHLSETNILPGISELIKELREHGIKIALTSASKNGSNILKKLRLLSGFDVIVDPSQVMLGKPAPDIFIAGANALGLDPQDCVGIEDSVAGITAINNSGSVSIGIGGQELDAANKRYVSTANLNYKRIQSVWEDANCDVNII